MVVPSRIEITLNAYVVYEYVDDKLFKCTYWMCAKKFLIRQMQCIAKNELSQNAG